MHTIQLLALCGSLRRQSYNRAVIEALQQLAPAHIQIVSADMMADLPLFNPDLEDSGIAAVDAFKQATAQADGFIIASPEYAHGISGVLKNALDWLVSGPEFVDMPVMLVNTSPRASHAQAALREVITTMSGHLAEEACLAVPLLGSDLDSSGIVARPDLAERLHSALQAFYLSIGTRTATV
ncbi:NADPH-dependent FMN reductase [Thalassolituus sp. C2-1]|uniref:NADPH-dependent FMN reductase n=1 Tax=Venatorbacter sp. C2-1 TaxID=2597518 RepID=UPI001191DC2B|nr:NADPH-dependent FMN reductase [Thalassolituus sp. C2-1]TVV45486.1 NAD(P)H-dependent oxidoreductase [Thalassolituus sp. C2-1]